jgi:hypothetical protein
MGMLSRGKCECDAFGRIVSFRNSAVHDPRSGQRPEAAQAYLMEDFGEVAGSHARTFGSGLVT